MNSVADRLSGLFFLLFGLALYFAIIPAYVETAESGNIAPNTLPNAMSVVIALCGAVLLIKPTHFTLQSSRLFLLALLYISVIAIGVYAMSHFGFLVIAPLLALAIMLLIGERRVLWLTGATLGVPAAIWFFVVQILDRALP